MADWKELKGGNVVKLEEGQRLEGEFVSIEVSATYPDSFALTLKVGEELQTIFVNNIVEDMIRRNAVEIGQEIAVLYIGMQENQAKTFKYKTYQLFVK